LSALRDITILAIPPLRRLFHGTYVPRLAGITIAVFRGKIQGGSIMNWDQMKGNWKQMKGKVKEQWGKLTDDELDQVEGKRDQLVGKIQKQYGITREEAERQVGDWESRL
jgi:uncharacterized protein YjbJ (UPF0337 family)